MDRSAADLRIGAVTEMISRRERRVAARQCWAYEAEVQNFGRHMDVRGCFDGDVLDGARQLCGRSTSFCYHIGNWPCDDPFFFFFYFFFYTKHPHNH
jgi:hypothetical protein